MQKVAKEHLGVMAKKGFKNPVVYPDNEQFTNNDYLMWILNQREVTLFGTLGKKMAVMPSVVIGTLELEYPIFQLDQL